MFCREACFVAIYALLGKILVHWEKVTNKRSSVKSLDSSGNICDYNFGDGKGNSSITALSSRASGNISLESCLWKDTAVQPCSVFFVCVLIDTVQCWFIWSFICVQLGHICVVCFVPKVLCFVFEFEKETVQCWVNLKSLLCAAWPHFLVKI